MKNILLISDLGQRYYFYAFIKPCLARGIRFILFDTKLFPHELRASFGTTAGDLRGTIQGIELPSERKQTLRLKDIDVAWYLRPGGVAASSFMTKLERRFTTAESAAALTALWSVLECKWVNKKETIEALETNKLLQQKIADRCGLKTPSTLITNDPTRLASFLNKRDDLLLKTMGYTKLDPGSKYFIYSQKFSAQELSKNRKAIRYCPVFAQHYVEKLFEYRVMAIGKSVLACRIDSQASDQTKIDWRHYDFERVEHKSVRLPRSLENKVLKFMGAAGLHYGAIDMIESTKGEFVFLEVNPSGQWDWLAKLAKLPIPNAVASMLAELI
jgi:glutathione synthase/RimK-type ligase-like ATP-grasp enzyme